MSKKILAFVLALVLVCSLVPAVAAAETEVRIDFGANGEAKHVDGNDLGTTTTYSENGYDLVLTDMVKVFGPAYDEQGNSCIKMGTNSTTGTFTFVVGEDVNEVVIYAAKYKAKNSKLNVNGTEYTLSVSSNDGAYDEIVVDTSATKTVTVATVASNARAMINAIVLKGASGSGSVTPSEPEATEPEATEPEVTEPEATEPVALPTTPEEIVNAAYALASGEVLEGTYTLTGVITAVNTPYSTQYSNVTVTIVVGEMTEQPIQCFRLKGTGADIIGSGDTITVTGTLKNYNGTVEFDAGCTLDSYVLGDAPEENLTTPEEIVNAAYALEAGTALEKAYTLTGVIYDVNTAYSADYGNITVTIIVGDMTDKPIMCYRMKGDGADLIGVGDTITVTGNIKNYNGTIEFDSGCTLDSYVLAEPGETEPVEVADAEISFATTDNRLSQDANQQVWQQNGITVTNDKGESTTDIIDSSNPVRFYKNSTVTIAAEGMVKIVVKCNTMAYATALVNSIADGATVTQNISEVTIELAEAVDSFSVVLSGGQIRVDKIGVYFAEGGEEEVKGDLNGDGVVTNDDVIVLLWNSMFPEENPVEGNVDYNGDGVVTNDDVIVLLWHSMFPEENPL